MDDGVTVAEQVVGEVTAPGIPSATVARLPSYLRALRDLVARGVGTTSSVELAELSGVGPAQLRKDLSFLGSFGTRGVGYDVDSLAQYITEALGLVDEHRIAIVGIGNLGHALANYSGYEQRGFHVAALLDASPDVVGTRAAGLVVEHVDALEEVVEREKVSIVVLATPAAHAQAVADRVVAAGVREILNFAPRALQVPADVDVRGVDVGSELQILAFHSQARALAASQER
ncbi:redox-sensing transcriptional repressor [Cellulosimicrobium sp. 4261]|jgi:redox-sensing transcriptional repressor|nr:redox-sensing transcriptional repressor Rex [Sphaerisporangium cinnabarinum]PTU54760.1 redox-sensing transcriptional repressor Rex [Sphaerisporangium cinnabarinum]SDF80713.1 redox-sensing transcriptional repressor [Cellulosimicrobium cellulans]